MTPTLSTQHEASAFQGIIIHKKCKGMLTSNIEYFCTKQDNNFTRYALLKGKKKKIF